MAIHGMIDLETLDVFPTATVLSLGAVKFNPFNYDEPYSELYIKIQIDDQDRLGRSVSDATIEWWGKQDPKIMEEAFDQSNAVSVEESLKQLNKWVVGLDTIWGQGYGFDLTILENMYRMTEQPIPWQFWQIKDSRTLFSLLPEDPRKSMQTNLHNALADAYYQAKAVQIAYNKLGVKDV